MTESEINAKLTSIFREVFNNASLQLHRDLGPKDIAAWDSFTHIILIVAVESRFGIKFKTAEAESLSTAGRFLDVLSAKLAVTD